MFAKPFVGALEHGHRDTVTATCMSRNALAPFVSAAADGEIRIWDLASQSLVQALPGAHSRNITGLVFANDGRTFYSCSDDGYWKSWNLFPTDGTHYGPCLSVSSPHIGSLKSMDHHRADNLLATASDCSVDIWSPERSAPIQSYQDLWGSDDTVNVIRYNPAERSLAATCSYDRGIGLFDTRSGSALRKTILKMRANCLEWNPMEPMNFVAGSEDYNAYAFDMRKLDQPLMIYKGHVGAILSLQWSPTGREFVTGSYDRTIRIFPHRTGTARDIYHTKRMQRVWTVNYTADHKYIVSGSDDTNIRLWKARASEKIGQMTAREERAMDYRQTLVQKYDNMPEIQTIYKSRKIPKFIKKQTQIAKIQKESQDRKQENRLKYDKKGVEQFVSERKKIVVKQVD
jgi:WD repeat and SOF domain-containing protein 1